MLPVYIGSAVLLLNPAGPTMVQDMLWEIPAMSLITIASQILAVILLELFEKDSYSILVWLTVMLFLPKLFLMGGMILRVRAHHGYRHVDACQLPHGWNTGHHVRMRHLVEQRGGNGQMPGLRRCGNPYFLRCRSIFIKEKGSVIRNRTMLSETVPEERKNNICTFSHILRPSSISYALPRQSCPRCCLLRGQDTWLSGIFL